jgi:tetratricopeptide (TPR) repeat protein
MQTRLESLEKMLQTMPGDRRLRYFLGLEYRKAGRHAEAAEQLRAYIDLAPYEDVGAAWRDLGLSLEQLGQLDQARAAYEEGIRSAGSHRHGDLAGEIQALLKRIAS